MKASRHIFGWLLSGLLVWTLSACATGPVEVARQYERGLREGRAERIAELTFQDGAPLVGSLARAMEEGRVSEFPPDGAWEDSRATARVETGDHFYLLTRDGGHWKVRCASIGPYHTQSPEMTLLFALHVIGRGDFEGFKGLLSSELRLAPDPVPADFREVLRQWAGWLSGSRCRPFVREGATAVLTYEAEGMRKRLVMVQEREGWRISTLW